MCLYVLLCVYIKHMQTHLYERCGSTLLGWNTTTVNALIQKFTTLLCEYHFFFVEAWRNTVGRPIKYPYMKFNDIFNASWRNSNQQKWCVAYKLEALVIVRIICFIAKYLYSCFIDTRNTLMNAVCYLYICVLRLKK